MHTINKVSEAYLLTISVRLKFNMDMPDVLNIRSRIFFLAT